ncbi:MAG: efflux RND transporter periplasmic adaptor subunit [Saprospiraceae bacterium]|jgi:RND family efflux transporter MFP subunit|nr:efflux RND transporter periplasmic adaptor subunit [Saprospiraceae bacterium]
MKYKIAAISIFSICFLACRSEQKEEPQSMDYTVQEAFVKIYPVVSQTESSKIDVLGIVMSESEARPSFKTGGVIGKTFVKQGDMVNKGQLLALLEMSEIDSQVRQVEEGLKKAERDMMRVENLFADSVATLEQFQNSKTAYEVSKRSAEIARFNRNYSEIRSPISGKVIKQIMFKGEITGPGNPVYAIMGVGKQDWTIHAGLTDRDWARVEVNDHVSASFDAYPGEVYSGIVSNKTSIGGNTSGTFDVEIKLSNLPKNLAGGLVSKLNIFPTQKRSYTVIPIDALVKSDGKTAFAYTVVNNKAKKIELSIARLLGDKVAVSKGLEGVDFIVTTGAIYLEDGDNVKY